MILDFRVNDRVTVGNGKEVYTIKNINPNVYTEKFACLVDKDGKESIVTFGRLKHAEDERSNEYKERLDKIAQKYFPGMQLYLGTTTFIGNLRYAMEDAYDFGWEDANTQNSE